MAQLGKRQRQYLHALHVFGSSRGWPSSYESRQALEALERKGLAQRCGVDFYPTTTTVPPKCAFPSPHPRKHNITPRRNNVGVFIWKEI